MSNTWVASRLTLATRLLLAAVACSAIILLIAGSVLSTSYTGAAERALDSRLSLYVQGLLADIADNGEGEEAEVDVYGETKFEEYLSGWYWQIDRLDEGNQYRLMSKSLGGKALAETSKSDLRSSQLREGFYTQGPDGKRVRVLERFLDQADNVRYRVRLGGDTSDMEADILNFKTALWLTFSFLALALSVAAIAQVRFGLKPLHVLQSAVNDVRMGKSAAIEGAYPPDLAPLAHELNLMIDTNRTVLERARTHAGNLAHALKTPLSILLNDASHQRSALALSVQRQTQEMNSQITTALNRARAAANAQRGVSLGTQTDVHAVVTRLLSMFAKVHHDKALMFDNRIPENIHFPVEREDLEEILSNLIDNACKWAKTTVCISGFVEQAQDKNSTSSTTHICVEDDGEGLAPELCATALLRGERLDTRQPGSGLGLSIVSELVQLYGGAITLTRSSMGGLKVEVRF
jgi:signal transduction histidine kinase